MNAYAVPHGASAAGSADREVRWWDSYNAAIEDGHDSYDAERIADAEVPPRQQCTGAVPSVSLSAPERCVLPEDHEGECTLSGSIPLTQRLVMAAAVALNAGSEQQAILRHGQDARAVTAAVLRETAEELFEELLSRVQPGMCVGVRRGGSGA